MNLLWDSARSEIWHRSERELSQALYSPSSDWKKDKEKNMIVQVLHKHAG